MLEAIYTLGTTALLVAFCVFAYAMRPKPKKNSWSEYPGDR